MAMTNNDSTASEIFGDRKIGMATSYPNTTEEVDSFRDKLKRLTFVEADVGIDEACRIYEAVHWARWAYKILCGAVVHWEYSKLFNEWSLRVCYWKSEVRCFGFHSMLPAGVNSFAKRLYFSGFCSRERGRHRTFQTKLQRN